ncbi:restriction endonuclease [Streptomyces nigra]|uniref:restriction endonuclease n=1 Tax=Streptomyces nigra TaxID=1827580 RepID=UPI0036C88730
MGRIRLRRPRGAAELVAAAVVALAVLVLVARTAATAVGALKAAWPALLALALLTGAVAAWRIRQATTMRRREKERLATLRITLAEFDTMDDRHFEYALRDLLVRDGWSARRVGGGGDQAADVIGDHPQRGRIVVQAKHTRVGGKVGSAVMYAVKQSGAGGARGGEQRYGSGGLATVGGACAAAPVGRCAQACARQGAGRGARLSAGLGRRP